jgi:hypothetical protein
MKTRNCYQKCGQYIPILLKEMRRDAISYVTQTDWACAFCHMKEHEEYWSRGGFVEEKLERFVINMGFASSNEDACAGNSYAKDRNSVKH